MGFLTKMRFAHMADCHIGVWNHPKMRDAASKAFERAIDACLDKKVDFVLISGDLFNSSLPDIDSLKIVVKKLRELKENSIPVYVIPGSHDFSPSGKTMLGVLEEAGLAKNVAQGQERDSDFSLKIVMDKKTGTLITGIIGKKGGLEQALYESLGKTEFEEKQGFKIFMFHTTLEEFKPKGMENVKGVSFSSFPKGFDYYAGGHVHYIFEKTPEGYGRFVYPGPLFPANFKELEELENGGFYIVETDGLELKLNYQPIIIYNTLSVKIDCNEMGPEEVQSNILKKFEGKELVNTIVTIRLFGKLNVGKKTEIDFRSIIRYLQSKGAVFVMKNTHKLVSKEFEDVEVKKTAVEEIESELIKEHLDQIEVKGWNQTKQQEIITALMNVLNTEKKEGERVADFEKRITDETNHLLE